MKRLSVIFATVALTLMLSGVAQASFLGMEAVNEYTWTYDMYQSVVDKNGDSVYIDTSSMEAAVNSLLTAAASENGAYLWGYFSVSQVQVTDSDPTQTTWVQTTDPGSLTGIFWGLQVSGFDVATGAVTFTGGEAVVYSGETDYSGLSSLDISDYMTDGDLDVDALLANESSWSDSDRFQDEVLTLAWTGGILASDSSVTQIAVNTGGTSETVIQGKFYADVTSDNNFSELIDSNLYGSEDADMYAQVGIQFSDGSWDFQGKSGDATMTAVPEPSTFLLIGLGMIGCFAYARRRRNNA